LLKNVVYYTDSCFEVKRLIVRNISN
jgi:hypothetical protein